MNYKILTVLGARPQFVKAAALSRALRVSYLPIEEKIVHTGQHFDDNMSDVFFREMEIPQPAFRLDVNNLGHGAMTGRMLEGVEQILIQEKPNMVLVYGDTNSTLAGALAASKLHIPVAHVEAGLRSFNMEMPEEINRILTDRISSILFCPTQQALDNLRAEGYEKFGIQLMPSGDVMQDAALYYLDRARSTSRIISQFNLKRKGYVLCTIHRAENTDHPARLKGICDALNHIANEVPVVLPLHPRTRKYLQTQCIHLNAHIIDPVGYFDMLMLIDNCSLILTDSGGLQKEAYFFSKYCITMRDQTEWIELVKGGFNRICGADMDKIVDAFENFKTKDDVFTDNLYGGGKAAQAISKALYSFLNGR